MKKYALIIILALILIALPYHLRLFQGNTTIAGDETYYHLKTGELVSQGNVDYFTKPYHLALAAGYLAFGKFSFIIIPIFFTLTTLLLFTYLLKKIKIEKQTRIWATLVLVLSPALISLGYYNTPAAFDLTLLLSATILLKTKFRLFAAIPLLLASIDSLAAAIAALFIIIYSSLTEYRMTTISMGAIPLACIALVPYKIPFMFAKNAITYFSDLGGAYGLGAFTIVLMLISAILLWPKKHYMIFSTIIAFFATAIIYPSLMPFALPITSILAGYALSFLFKRKWELKSLRKLTLFIIFLGLLFSAISHATTLAEDTPQKEFLETLSLIPSGNILTAEKYGNWVAYKGHNSLINPLEQSPEEITSIFYITDLQKTTNLLEKYKVDYVLITEEMKKGLTWDEEDFGLAFLVNNNETFKTIQTGNSIELYRVT